MPTYLERYLNGECVEVWADLVRLGAKVRQKSVLPDMEAVASETMNRARRNLEILIPRLAAVGYRFAAPALERRLEKVNKTLAEPKWNSYVLRQRQLAVERGTAPASILEEPVPEALLIPYREEKGALAAELKRMKTLPPLENPRVFYGPQLQDQEYWEHIGHRGVESIPMSLRAWYKHVGYVSFVGVHDVLNPAANAIADPLVVVSLPDFYKGLCYADPGDEKRVALSDDDLEKAGLPKSTPGVESPLRYQITLPNAAADFKLENEWHATHFVEYLRRAFQWAGFPGWERDPNPPRELISELTEGLLPI